MVIGVPFAGIVMLLLGGSTKVCAPENQRDLAALLVEPKCSNHSPGFIARNYALLILLARKQKKELPFLKEQPEEREPLPPPKNH